jgi:hypothetical protein
MLHFYLKDENALGCSKEPVGYREAISGCVREVDARSRDVVVPETHEEILDAILIFESCVAGSGVAEGGCVVIADLET